MKKTSTVATVLALAAFAIPLFALAQSGINLNAVTPYSDGIINLINGILVPVLIAIAFITFLWGIFKYFIWGAENESEKAEGRKFALWGIIGFVIIVSLWGIVNLLMSTLGLTAGNAPPSPTYNTGSYMPGGGPGFGGGGTVYANQGQAQQAVYATQNYYQQQALQQAGFSAGSVRDYTSCVNANVDTSVCMRAYKPVTDYNSCIGANVDAGACRQSYPSSAPKANTSGLSDGAGCYQPSDCASGSCTYDTNRNASFCGSGSAGTGTGGGSGGTSSGSGCTDSSASNYNPYAETNDGSCTFPNSTGNSTGDNYNNDYGDTGGI